MVAVAAAVDGDEIGRRRQGQQPVRPRDGRELRPGSQRPGLNLAQPVLIGQRRQGPGLADPAHPEVIAWRKQQVMDTPAEVFLNVFDIYAETEMAPWLHEVAAPAQIITGKNDGGCNPRLNRLIQKRCPGRTW